MPGHIFHFVKPSYCTILDGVIFPIIYLFFSSNTVCLINVILCELDGVFLARSMRYGMANRFGRYRYLSGFEVPEIDVVLHYGERSIMHFCSMIKMSKIS